MADEPLRTQTAFILHGGLKNKPGTLLLYPDRLSHVASGALAAGAAGGALGMVMAGKVAKNKAAGKEEEGGKGVTTIPLTQVTAVRKGKAGLNSKILEVEASDGTVVKFGVKFVDWKPDLVNALVAAGRSVDDGGDVVTAS